MFATHGISSTFNTTPQWFHAVGGGHCPFQDIVYSVVYLFSISPRTLAMGSRVRRRGPEDVQIRLQGWHSDEMLNIHNVFVDAILYKMEDYQ
jgi:hypothetical protein